MFGLFSKDRALKKTIERATNKLSQSPDRWSAMEKLRDEGSDEALLALCKRFGFSYDKTIEDQDEKEWVVGVLASRGEPVLPILERYMMSATALGYPLAALARVGSPERALAVVDALLAAEEPGYVRDPKKRIDIIEWLTEWDGVSDRQVVDRVVPYLVDFDENVRIKSIEAIAHNPDPSAAPALIEALVNPAEESKRIRQRIGEVLADNAMPLGERRDEVEKVTQNRLEGFSVQGDLLIRS